MWYNLSLERVLSNPGYLYKLGVYTKNVTVSLLIKHVSLPTLFIVISCFPNIYALCLSNFTSP